MSQSINPELKTVIDKVSNHLEFLGYEVKIGDENPQEMIALHPERANILVKVFTRAVRFTCFYYSNTFAQQNRLEFLELINTLNQNSAITQCSLDDEGTLIITSFLFGIYDKITFGQFMDLWHDDIEKIRGTDRMYEFFG